MTGHLRVVIVEDVEADAELIALRLSEAGYQVDWRRVDCEQDYLTSLDATPDLILADWTLPRFSGLRALELTRARGLDVPFLIVSGSIGEESAVDALRLGANDYVTKDRPSRLGPAVRRALEEKELRVERRRIQDQLLLLTRAVEQSPVSVMITGRSGDIEYVNPKFTEVSGYTAQEVLGRNPRLLKSGETAEPVYRELWETIGGGGEWRGELHNRRKDGGLFWERIFISPVRDGSGGITHFVAVKEDITAQKLLESQLLQSQKMESVGRLAGGIAHDFNNLLTVINGYGDLVLSALPESDPQRPAVAAMRDAGGQAAKLTQQLLAFSRKQIIAPAALDLNAVVSETKSLLRRLIGEDIELITELDPGLGTALAEGSQLQQVLMNLAINARDAMPKGGRLTIRTANVEAEASGTAVPPGRAAAPQVLVAVSDTGAGMDEATLSHLFEPFFTTKGPGAGTGLGLSTAYGIVKQFGGEITVRSAPGSGTEFRIYLPRVEAPAAAAPGHEDAPLDVAGTETVLVVEDQQSVAKLVARNLGGCGYRTLVAAGGKEALEIAGSYAGPIHLLLTDVVMPGMTGRELAERLRVSRPAMKVLYMSGYTHNVIVNKGVLKPDIEFIAKPFGARELTSRVRQILNEPGRAEAAPAELPAPARAGERAPAPRQACVLVADDMPMVRRLFVKILSRAGFAVVEAANGDEIHERLAATHVDVALVDLHMPGQNSLAAIRQCRAKYPDLKIILTSAAFEEEAKDSQSYGVDVVVGKSAPPALLVDTIRRLSATVGST